MKRFFLIIIVFSFSIWSAGAQNEVLFQQGNSAYADGNYTAAIENYEKILESGETAAEVHFNLANAHYKLNQLAPSIYHYERALQLDPGDSDIRNNLQYAQNMTVDAIEEVSENGFREWWNSFLSSFTTSQWAVAGIICMVLFVLLFLGYYFSATPLKKRVLFISGMVFLVLSLGTVALGFLLSKQLEQQNFAIVFSEEISVSSEPNSRSEELFYLHEGTKVEVLEDFQEWSKIQLSNGNQGWILQEAIKKL